jgi:WD40 repeat protein
MFDDEGHDADASYFVELIRPDGNPRMPYKLDPLPENQREVIERWVREGANFDGEGADANWVSILNRSKVAAIPEAYPTPLPVTALAFEPGGGSLEVSGYHEVNRYAVADGALQGRTPGVAERVYDLAYSADGKWLATASGTPGTLGSAKLWKVGEGGALEPAKELMQADDAVLAVAFRPDGAQVAVAGTDRAIRVFNVETGEQVGLIEDHADWIFDIAYSPDGKRLVSASRDKTSKVFDAEKFESLVTFPGHNEVVFTAAFSADGKTVASGGQDNRIRLWTPDDEAKQVREIGGFGGSVLKLAFAGPDGSSLAACSVDKVVRVFNPADGAVKHTLNGHNDWVYSLAVSPDGQTLASGSWDGEVRLWTLADGKPGAVFVAAPGFKAPVAAAAAQP